MEEWEIEFNHYKESVEYKTVNKDITLKQFKQIYFIEWFHRLCGSSLGIFYFSGLSLFSLLGFFTKKSKRIFWGLLGVGAMQGLIGWWMVKSGIHQKADYHIEPSVSTYRLVFHNSTAMFLFSVLSYHSIMLLTRTNSTKSLVQIYRHVDLFQSTIL